MQSLIADARGQVTELLFSGTSVTLFSLGHLSHVPKPGILPLQRTQPAGYASTFFPQVRNHFRVELSRAASFALPIN